MDYRDILLRLTASVLIGGLIGLDRNLHGKPSGVRTLGLVSMGAALLTMASMGFGTRAGEVDADAVSRVVQGLITGIGFLGAGVIIHEQGSDRVRGLTTAASIWITAILGVVCGMGAWQMAGIALMLVFLLLVVGKRVERFMHRRWLDQPDAGKQADTQHNE